MGVTFYSGLILLVLQMNLCSLSKTPDGECNSAATLKACANESILADRAPIFRVKFKYENVSNDHCDSIFRS